MTRGYDAVNRRYVEVGDSTVRDRVRAKRCDDCRAVLAEHDDQWTCPTCGKTADEMAQEARS